MPVSREPPKSPGDKTTASTGGSLLTALAGPQPSPMQWCLEAPPCSGLKVFYRSLSPSTPEAGGYQLGKCLLVRIQKGVLWFKVIGYERVPKP